MKSNDQRLNQTRSYLALRKVVGWIAILLPFTLIAGESLLFNGERILFSISQYYYSGMRDVFVGALCAIALFLFFYRGHDKRDNWAGNIAGFAALGTAFFPTPEHGESSWLGVVHFICASCFFLTLAGFSLFLFTRKDTHPTREKLKRNKIHVVCGSCMIASMIAIIIYFNFFHAGNQKSSFVFWTETFALVAFGISWLTKGGTICPDKNKTDASS